jgi:predicted metal-binding transcription factor (methanogenesis marker protein 9)
MGFIIHLELHTGEHRFFGSIAAIYTCFTTKQVGVSQRTLYKYNLSEEHSYSNKLCTIRKAKLIRKANKEVE